MKMHLMQMMQMANNKIPVMIRIKEVEKRLGSKI
jgi:hypothetical protein